MKDKKYFLYKAAKLNIKYFKVVLIFLIVVGAYIFVKLSTNTNVGLDGVGYVLALVILLRFAEISIIALVPVFIAGKCAMRYYYGKTSKLIASWFWGIFSILGLISIIMLYNMVFKDSFNSFSLSGFNSGLYYLSILYLIIAFGTPSIVFIIGCIREQFASSIFKKLEFSERFYNNKQRIYAIIGLVLSLIFLIIIIRNTFGHKSEKIEVNYSMLPNLKQFENELYKRKLIDSNSYELTQVKSITAIDKDSEYEHQLSFMNDKNSIYPVFIYSGYSSLIEKSNLTAYYYSKGPEDWWINWDIYYVNGQIYAVIGDESELNKRNYNNLLYTENRTVVSERDEITTYNWKKNYFSYGGGIKKIKNGYVRYLVNEMVDTRNSRCIPITKVDRLDADALDKISKKIAYGK